MFGLNKKKRDKDEDMPPFDEQANLGTDNGEGKFPPPEQAFAEPSMAPMDNELGLPPMPDTPSMPPLDQERPSSLNMNSRPQIVQPPQPVTPLSGDKMEVVIAKIDGLKNMIEVLNQRIANLEQKISNNERRW